MNRSFKSSTSEAIEEAIDDWLIKHRPDAGYGPPFKCFSIPMGLEQIDGRLVLACRCLSSLYCGLLPMARLDTLQSELLIRVTALIGNLADCPHTVFETARDALITTAVLQLVDHWTGPFKYRKNLCSWVRVVDDKIHVFPQTYPKGTLPVIAVREWVTDVVFSKLSALMTRYDSEDRQAPEDRHEPAISQ